jgi:hypothetical protein
MNALLQKLMTVWFVSIRSLQNVEEVFYFNLYSHENEIKHENSAERTASLLCSTYGNPLVVVGGLRFVISNFQWCVWVGFLIFEESTPASWDARRRSHFRLYLQGSMISSIEVI